MIKKTFMELMEIDSVVAKLYQKSPDLRETKFGVAYKKFHKPYGDAMEKVKDRLEDISIANAAVDPVTNVILRDPEDPRGYKFTREGAQKVAEQERKFNIEQEKVLIEVEPQFFAFIPELTDLQKDILSCMFAEPNDIPNKKVDGDDDKVVAAKAKSEKEAAEKDEETSNKKTR